ncbi:hypothetical protein RRG08_031292 [Elysia crispata]|uniref:Uncharacterized protein n=1 Tax=Elysia crispata TaxID=231223 RepID=A0AAE1AK78_9GAST|nr:hypothetical protein RRG08_031292 [Elysia crispata]
MRKYNRADETSVQSHQTVGVHHEGPSDFHWTGRLVDLAVSTPQVRSVDVARLGKITRKMFLSQEVIFPDYATTT